MRPGEAAASVASSSERMHESVCDPGGAVRPLERGMENVMKKVILSFLVFVCVSFVPACQLSAPEVDVDSVESAVLEDIINPAHGYPDPLYGSGWEDVPLDYNAVTSSAIRGATDRLPSYVAEMGGVFDASKAGDKQCRKYQDYATACCIAQGPYRCCWGRAGSWFQYCEIRSPD